MRKAKDRIDEGEECVYNKGADLEGDVHAAKESFAGGGACQRVELLLKWGLVADEPMMGKASRKE